QLSLRSLKLLQLRGIRRRFIGIKLHASDAGPRIRHFSERRLLEIGRARNRVHEIRDQICAPLIDVLHLRPTLIDALLQPDKTIIAAGDCKCSDDDNEKQEEEYYTTTDTECFHR